MHEHTSRAAAVYAPTTHTHIHKELCPRRVDAAAREILSRVCKKIFPITVMKVNPHLRLKQSYSKSEYLIALVEMAKQRYASDSNESTSLGILQRL